MLALFPTSKDGTAVRHRSGGKNCHSEASKPAMADMGYGGKGSAARFFYCAKASKKERNAGLGEAGNTHCTVKPIALMRWLVRMVTPPGGTVLDPFMGSGTTGIAAKLEGAEFIGIELDAEYCELARARIDVAMNP